MTIQLTPIGFVESSRKQVEDDFWGDQVSSIRLVEPFGKDSLAGLAEFSHVEVLFLLHDIDLEKVITGARHPRNNPAWPLTGVFAQRTKNRPNRIGATICAVDRVEGACLYVRELDAIDGTPVLDLKPVLAEFLPRGPVRQPEWSRELMREYWSTRR